MTPLARKVFELFGKTETGQKTPPQVSAESSCSPSWPCPQCGGKVCFDPEDATILPTRLWTCSMCEAYGTTREGAAFPIAWVRTRGAQ